MTILQDSMMVFAPYIPFLYEYWPFIITGMACFLATTILFKTSFEQPADCLPPELTLDDYSDSLKEIDEEEDEEEDENEINKLKEQFIQTLPVNIKHVPYDVTRYSESESLKKSEEFFQLMNKRRTLRYFSSEPVNIEVIRNIIKTAGTAPSGAHTEPWTFVVVSDLETKIKIRVIIEAEEEINVKKRFGEGCLDDMKKYKTDWSKDYLTTAPFIILVFQQVFGYNKMDGTKILHYYNEMSVSLACGILLTAIHSAGLVSLTSTPINCGNALRKLLKRPKNEKLTLLLPVGYPAEDATVPDLDRKSLDEILVEI